MMSALTHTSTSESASTLRLEFAPSQLLFQRHSGTIDLLKWKCLLCEWLELLIQLFGIQWSIARSARGGLLSSG
eukprot:424061-Amphidinium_carterae.1